ncbi:MAG: HNH endonuclease [Lachnospiraceae bacterium]|nr:HNH endonuclease [Lachnospiraceae bacterium]
MNELRKETVAPEFRNKLKESIGFTCANCGSSENIEYHHIVPLKLGGTNRITNFAPLCHQCNEAALNGRHISKYINRKNSGRKKKTSKEQAYAVYDLYVNGEIGTRKCKELLGYNFHGSIKSMAYFNDYMKDKGINKIRNNIDIVGTNSSDKLFDGRIIGRVEYVDGTGRNIVFRDTGLNNIEYVQRNLEC